MSDPLMVTVPAEDLRRVLQYMEVVQVRSFAGSELVNILDRFGDEVLKVRQRADLDREEAERQMERIIDKVLDSKVVVPDHPRHVGPEPGHLSECLLVAHPDHPHGCTCGDYYPESDSG